MCLVPYILFTTGSIPGKKEGCGRLTVSINLIHFIMNGSIILRNGRLVLLFIYFFCKWFGFINLGIS